MAQNQHSGLMIKNFDELLKNALTPSNVEDSERSWVGLPLEIRRFSLGYLSFRDLVRCRSVSKSFLAIFAYLVQRLERIKLEYGSMRKHEYCAIYSFIVFGQLRSLKHFEFPSFPESYMKVYLHPGITLYSKFQNMFGEQNPKKW
eukprot:217113_1